jgi:hypothetical protein
MQREIFVKQKLLELVGKVSGMYGSAREFAEHLSEIHEKATEAYKQLTGDAKDIPVEEIRHLVDTLYRTVTESAIHQREVPFILRSGGHVAITTDGVRVEGVVDVSPKILEVTILSPFAGKKASSELEMIAPVIWTELPEDGSEANDAGKRRALSLLSELYYSNFKR